MVEAETGTSRPLPNFEPRTSTTALPQSMSRRSSRRASPTRMPVTASKPNRVAKVSARKAKGLDARAPVTSAPTSSAENR